jgi:hypothetical protein
MPGVPPTRPPIEDTCTRTPERCSRRTEAGEFVIEAAASSMDIRAAATVSLPDDPHVPPLIDDDTLGGRP